MWVIDALTVRIVCYIKIYYVGFIRTKMKSYMLNYKTVAAGGPYDGRPIVLRTAFWRRRSGVRFDSFSRRRPGRLEVLVEISAVRTGAESLESVSGGVAVSWKYLRHRVVGRKTRRRRGEKPRGALTTVIVRRAAVTSVTVSVRTVARVLTVKFLFTICQSMLRWCALQSTSPSSLLHLKTLPQL